MDSLPIERQNVEIPDDDEIPNVEDFLVNPPSVLRKENINKFEVI